MAFTLYQEPETLTPVYNDIKFIFHDTNGTDPNFKYVITVKWGFLSNQLNQTQIITLYPRLNNVYTTSIQYLQGHQILNISSILKNQLNYKYQPGLLGHIDTYNSILGEYIYYQIIIKESVNDTTIYTSATKTAWNGIADRIAATNLSTYVSQFGVSTSTPGNLMNVSNYNKNLTLNDYATLTIKPKGTNSVASVQILTNTNKLFTKTIATPGDIIHFGVGPANINATTWTSVSPVGATITEADSSYTVTFVNTGSIPVLKTITYNIISACKYDPYRIDFQANNGGFNFMNFDLKHYETISNKKDTYDKIYPYNYAVTDRTSTVYSNETYGTWELNTDWLNQFEVEEMEELLQSPTLFLVDKSNITIPVYIDSVKKEINNVKQDKLVRYTIEVKEAFKRNTIY